MVGQFSFECPHHCRIGPRRAACSQRAEATAKALDDSLRSPLWGHPAGILRATRLPSLRWGWAGDAHRKRRSAHPARRPQWFIAETPGIADLPAELDLPAGDCRVRFAFVRRYETWGLSSVGWALYRAN